MQRYKNLQLIEQLDPVQDCCQICHLIVGYEFPWDMTRSLEIALFRTFCIPSISKLLQATGEFSHRPQKRYDDTALLLNEILKSGYDSDRGKEAIQRMNQIHGRFHISNQDFLYVLSTFIYDPIRWLDRFGWRKMCQKERLACFYFWCEVGKRMQIQDIPETFEKFEQYNLNFERQYFQYSESNARLGENTLNLFLGWFPSFLRPALKPMILALLDETMLDAFGFAASPNFLRSFVAITLKLRGQIVRLLPPHKQALFLTDIPNRSYPTGYQISDLGPPSMLETLNRKD